MVSSCLQAALAERSDGSDRREAKLSKKRLIMTSFSIASYHLDDDLVYIEICMPNKKYVISDILENDENVFNVENGSGRYMLADVTLNVHSTKRGALVVAPSVLKTNAKNFAEIKENLANNPTVNFREGFDLADFLKLYQMLARSWGGFGLKDPKQFDTLLDEFMIGLDPEFIYSRESNGSLANSFNKWAIARGFNEIVFGNREVKYELTKNEVEYFLEIMNYRVDRVYTDRRVDIIPDIKKYGDLKLPSPFNSIFNKRKPEDLSLEF